MTIKVKKIGLIVAAAVSALGAVVAACKATLVAKEIVTDDTLTKRQKAVRIALAYLLAVCTATVSVLSLKSFLNIKNQETATAQFIALDHEDAIQMYRASVSKEVKDEQRIWESSNVLRLTDGGCPFTIDQVDYTTGDMVFYDQLHRTWYIDKRDRILNAEKDTIGLVKSGKKKEGVSLNMYWDKVGLPHTEYGDYLGWTSINKEDGKLFDYSVVNRAEDGLVYTVILYKLRPYKLDNKKEGDDEK